MGKAGEIVGSEWDTYTFYIHVPAKRCTCGNMPDEGDTVGMGDPAEYDRWHHHQREFHLRSFGFI